MGSRFCWYMKRPFAAPASIFMSAVTPAATATAATMRTAEAILTATGRLANQPADRRGVGGEEASVDTQTVLVARSWRHPDVVTRGLLSLHDHVRGLSVYGFINRDV